LPRRGGNGCWSVGGAVQGAMAAAQVVGDGIFTLWIAGILLAAGAIAFLARRVQITLSRPFPPTPLGFAG